MSRTHTVAKLPPAEFEFVIRCILDNLTNREISAAYYKEFKKKLAKSSLARWREAAGNELADRYQMARVQAKQLLEHLKEEPDADKYQLLMRSVEERLLTVTREAIALDPIKMLRLRQEEEKRRLKERQLELNERKLEFEQKRAEREENFHGDRFKMAADTWQFILVWFAQKNPQAADLLTGNSEELLNALETHLEDQAA
jgi:CHAT domain-containing protein